MRLRAATRASHFQVLRDQTQFSTRTHDSSGDFDRAINFISRTLNIQDHEISRGCKSKRIIEMQNYMKFVKKRELKSNKQDQRQTSKRLYRQTLNTPHLFLQAASRWAEPASAPTTTSSFTWRRRTRTATAACTAETSAPTAARSWTASPTDTSGTLCQVSTPETRRVSPGFFKFHFKC